MSIPDWLLLAIQWVHHLGAVAWVGGSIFYKFVLQPAFRKANTEGQSVRAIGQEFRGIVYIAIIILVVTGVIMSVAHLSAGGNSTAYVALLALKVSLAFYMFLVVWLRRRPSAPRADDAPPGMWRRFKGAITSTAALLVIGIAIIGVADVLGALHGGDGHSHGSSSHSESGHGTEASDGEADHGHDNGHDHGPDTEASDGEGDHGHDTEATEGEGDHGHDNGHDHEHQEPGAGESMGPSDTPNADTGTDADSDEHDHEHDGHDQDGHAH